MEIVIVWSWFSFIAGAVSALFGSFLLLLLVALKQWKRQKKAAEQQAVSFDKMTFSPWGSRDNNPL
jgi:membrane associated rhomboid family serine protease